MSKRRVKDTSKNKKNDAALRGRAEAELKQRFGSVEPETLSVEDACRLVHELQVHQIELEMQNEELRLSQSMLEESRTGYSNLYDFAPVGYFTFDKEGVILEANLTGAALLGVERARLIKKPFTAFLTRDSQDAFYLHRRKVRESGERQTCELKLKGRDGTEFFAELESLPAEDKTVRTAVSDITGRKQAEAELARLASYPELNPNPVIELDDAGKVHYLNPAAKDLLGTEKPGRHPFLTDIPEKLGGKTDIVREVKVGDYWYVQEIHDVSGSDRIRVYARDITDRKRAEEALAASEERHRAIFEQARDGIVLMDYESGRIVDCNAEYERQTGRKLEELRKMKVWELRPRNQVETARRMFGELKNKGEVASSDLVYLRPDGGITPIDFISKLITIRGKKYLQGITRDITERKKVEEELNKYRQNLEQMVEERASEVIKVNRHLRREIRNREKMEEEILKVQKLESVGILAGGIAHDFNNALTAIMNSVSTAKKLLKDGEKSDKALKTLDAALKSVRRATTMTHQLLTFAEGGEPIRKVAYVRNLIADTADFSLRGSNVKCEFRFSDDLWPAYVDEGQIVQVLSNLVINADQSMPEGGTMEIGAENIEVKNNDSLPLDPGRYIKLTVRDDGEGISKKDLPKIFDPYFTTKEEGSGLGLASAYSIVKKHNGLITVESKVGSGTAFYVYLPASDSEVIEAAGIEDSDFRGARILLMDDEEDVRDSVASALTLHGFEPAIAEDGSRALEAYKEARKSGKPFDAIVMDLTVRGGMGGVEAVREIQKIDPAVKAVVISGYSNDPVMADYANFGFVRALRKPFDIEELCRVLQEATASKIQ